MSDAGYIKILNRYFYTDLVMMAILFGGTVVSVVVILKTCPYKKGGKKKYRRENRENRAARALACTGILLMSVFGGILTGQEIWNLSQDIHQENFISCSGSYSATRNDMTVTTESGDVIRLQYLHHTVTDFASESAEIVYAEKSRILLSCKPKE